MTIMVFHTSKYTTDGVPLTLHHSRQSMRKNLYSFQFLAATVEPTKDKPL